MHPSNVNDKTDDYHNPQGQNYGQNDNPRQGQNDNLVDQSSMRVNITVSKRLIQQADDIAKAEYTTRSDIIRQALLEYLRKPESLQKLAANITGRDVVLQCFLDDYQKRHPDQRPDPNPNEA